jgi:hypothetical protein
MGADCPPEGASMPPPRNRSLSVVEHPSEPAEHKTFLATVIEYKEIVALVLVVAGGASGIVSYFATKEEVKQVRCLLNTNIEFIDDQIQTSRMLEEMREDDAEVMHYREIEHPNSQELLALHEKMEAYDLAKLNRQRLDMAMRDAQKRIMLNACADESTPKPTHPNLEEK